MYRNIIIRPKQRFGTAQTRCVACHRLVCADGNEIRQAYTRGNSNAPRRNRGFSRPFETQHVEHSRTLPMKYHQRDIVEVNFLFPDGTFKPHPAIIVSNDGLQEDEFGLLYLVLITSNDTINPQYSYPLTDEMIVGHTFSKPSLVKCQIIAGYVERDVYRRLGSIKEKYFNEIIDKVIESIF